MRFTVIIPTFNRRDLLEATLESIWRQHFTDYEVIVVDDGSTDGTLAWLESMGDRIKLVRQTNEGPGSARNLGAREARGDYLAFLDSDDVWFPWSLQCYAGVIEKTAPPSFIAGKPLRFRDGKELDRAQEEPVKFQSFTDYLHSGDEWRWWGVSSFVMRREQVLACGGFAEEHMNSEDADLALKLGTAPGFVQITEPVTFGYREHSTNVTGNLDKTLAGTWHNIDAERAGGYPGGSEREKERWTVLTRHVRPVILGCLKSGRRSEAWKMYRATFGWHVSLCRWRFLMSFPVLSLFSRFRQAH